MCLLFETIKVVDGKVCNLPYHQHRVDKWSEVDLLTYINRNVTLPTSTLQTHKLRITYSQTAIHGHSIEPYTPRLVTSLKIIRDDSVDYAKKFNDRTAINSLIARRGDCDDILIIKNGAVTDISFANIIFRDSQSWVTPDTPLLEGSCRARLIEQNAITPRPISLNDLNLFSEFMIINAMLNFDTQQAVKCHFNGTELVKR